MKITDALVLWLMTLAIITAWPIVELALYGEVQPRRVDDIIGLCWMAEVAIAYYLGYRRGRLHDHDEL